MNPPKPQRIVLAVLAIIVMLAWAIIAYVAIQVTETILLMLDYIVELAALT
jgi:predicted metal-binding membrane protein